MLSHLRPAIVSLLTLSLLTGVAYPLLVTGLAQVIFPRQANGSLIVVGGQPVGSSLIGQPFNDPRYFWGRPSATAPVPYNGEGSGGSNLGPLNPVLHDAIKERIERLQAADPGNKSPIPVDLVTASASGLDPHISPAAARFQVTRVARARNLPSDQVRNLVEQHVHGRFAGFLGESTVNVLELNLALDQK